MAFADILRSTTWTGTDAADLIEGIFVSGHPLAWTTWSPSYSCSGSMTYTTVTTNYAKYIRVGKLIIASIYASGTTGGVASTEIRATLPANAVATTNFPASATIVDTSSLPSFAYTSTTYLAFSRYDLANWSLAAGRQILGTIIYEAA